MLEVKISGRLLVSMYRHRVISAIIGYNGRLGWRNMLEVKISGRLLVSMYRQNITMHSGINFETYEVSTQNFPT